MLYRGQLRLGNEEEKKTDLPIALKWVQVDGYKVLEFEINIENTGNSKIFQCFLFRISQPYKLLIKI